MSEISLEKNDQWSSNTPEKLKSESEHLLKQEQSQLYDDLQKEIKTFLEKKYSNQEKVEKKTQTVMDKLNDLYQEVSVQSLVNNSMAKNLLWENHIKINAIAAMIDNSKKILNFLNFSESIPTAINKKLKTLEKNISSQSEEEKLIELQGFLDEIKIMNQTSNSKQTPPSSNETLPIASTKEDQTSSNNKKSELLPQTKFEIPKNKSFKDIKSSDFEKGKTTLCAKTTRLNLKNIFGINAKSWNDAYEGANKHWENFVWEVGSITDQKDIVTTAFTDRALSPVAQIFTESKSENGHTAVAFLNSTEWKRYVLDPYTKGKITTPIPLDQYASKRKIYQANFYTPEYGVV